MTAPNYITLDSDDIGANKIARAAMFSALDSNPVAHRPAQHRMRHG